MTKLAGTFIDLEGVSTNSVSGAASLLGSLRVQCRLSDTHYDDPLLLADVVTRYNATVTSLGVGSSIAADADLPTLLAAIGALKLLA